MHLRRQSQADRLSKAHSGIYVNKFQLNKDDVRKPVFNVAYNDGWLQDHLNMIFSGIFEISCNLFKTVFW